MLDKKIEAAISEAVSEESQDAALTRRLINWISDLASGNESLDDADSSDRHLELLYDAVEIDSSLRDDAED